MKYVDEFRNRSTAKKLLKTINLQAQRLKNKVSLMEVCGTHTVALFRYGIKKLLPKNINLISGPGCPVCVTAQEDVDKAIALSGVDGVIITTFGDMMNVPGTNTNLTSMKAERKDIRVVYSVLDALEIARINRKRQVVHIAIGFETTVPTIAAALKRAKAEKLKNFFILTAHKIIPPALKVLAESPKSKIDGLLLPGHVSAVIGAKPYNFLAKKFRISCVISGFEANDILQSISILLEQINMLKPKVEIQYKRSVSTEGNIIAKKIIDEVFKVSDVQWRGLGLIKASGLVLKRGFIDFDAERHFSIRVPKQKKSACRCGDILQGIISPVQCPLFRKKCSPQTPVGPCMVSSEGTCAAYYRYGDKNE